MFFQEKSLFAGIKNPLSEVLPLLKSMGVFPLTLVQPQFQSHSSQEYLGHLKLHLLFFLILKINYVIKSAKADGFQASSDH